MPTTSDPSDPRLYNVGENGQNEMYLVLTPEDRRKGFVRPVFNAYVHVCGTVTRIGTEIAETYARNPGFYASTFCVGCGQHRPLDEFVWDGTTMKVGS